MFLFCSICIGIRCRYIQAHSPHTGSLRHICIAVVRLYPGDSTRHGYTHTAVSGDATAKQLLDRLLLHPFPSEVASASCTPSSAFDRSTETSRIRHRDSFYTLSSFSRSSWRNDYHFVRYKKVNIVLFDLKDALSYLHDLVYRVMQRNSLQKVISTFDMLYIGGSRFICFRKHPPIPYSHFKDSG